MEVNIIGIIFGAIFLLVVFLPDITDKRYEIKERKLKTKYPAYFQKLEEENAVTLNRSYKELKVIQFEIDKLTNEMRYVPKEDCSTLEHTIKHWQDKYKKTKIICQNKEAEIARIHAEAMEIYHATPELIKFYKYSE